MNFDCTGEVNPTQVPDENIVKSNTDPEINTLDLVQIDTETGTRVLANEPETVDVTVGEKPVSIVETSATADKESNQSIENEENRTDGKGIFSLELTEIEQFSLNVENLNMRKQDLWYELKSV